MQEGCNLYLQSSMIQKRNPNKGPRFLNQVPTLALGSSDLKHRGLGLRAEVFCLGMGEWVIGTTGPLRDYHRDLFPRSLLRTRQF